MGKLMHVNIKGGQSGCSVFELQMGHTASSSPKDVPVSVQRGHERRAGVFLYCPFPCRRWVFLHNSAPQAIR